MEKIIFTSFRIEEKLYWYHYLAWMEFCYTEDMALKKPSFELSSSSEKREMIWEARKKLKAIYSLAKSQLLETLSREELTMLSPADKSATFEAYNFDYLLRDWGVDLEYDQRKIITAFIRQKLAPFIKNPYAKSLFLGCGNGRYAVDFASEYDHVYACDKSLMMIWTTLRLCTLKKWSIQHEILRNCRSVSDAIQESTVEITDDQIQTIKEKCTFLVSDVLTLPHDTNSVDHIFSIYFTDVLPLTALWSKVNQLLSPGGLFIHFGPLEYFFTNESDMLSAEEVREFVQRQGYIIKADEFLETRHLYMKNSMRHRVYDNWFFIAEKPVKRPITLDTVVVLNEKAKVFKTTHYSDDGKQTLWTVDGSKQSFELPPVVAKLLNSLHSKKPLEYQLNKLGRQEWEADDVISILGILNELYNNEIINIIDEN